MKSELNKFIVELNKSFSLKEMQSILEDLFLLDLKSVKEFKEMNAVDSILKKHYFFAKKIKAKNDMILVDDIFFDLYGEH